MVVLTAKVFKLYNALVEVIETQIILTAETLIMFAYS